MARRKKTTSTEAPEPISSDAGVDTAASTNPLITQPMAAPAAETPVEIPMAAAMESPRANPTNETREPVHAELAEPNNMTRKMFDPLFAISADYVAGVRLLEHRQFKQMQLKFNAKPSDEVRQMVRDAGFQWRAKEEVWSQQIDPAKAWQTRARANETFEKVTAQIRTEMGITQEVA